MSRINIPSFDETPEASRPILENVKKMLGFVPNLQRLLSISPAALSGWASLMGSLSKTLDAKTRDGIALVVSEENGCHYCLSAHAWVASNLAKVSPEEIAINRNGESSDPKRQAALKFAKALIEKSGKVTDDEFNAVRSAGYTDAQIIEIISLSAQFLLTNFINNAVDTDIDFPISEPPRSTSL
jgi:uncharacterized peroxidase-related enzyme